MDIHNFKTLVEENTNESNLKLKEYLNFVDAYTIVFPHGENLLHFACGAGNVDICRYLIEEKKIHPNIYNSRGTTPLIYACIKNQLEVIQLLILHNADPRIRSGFSGLFPYQSTSNKEIIKILMIHELKVPIDYENGLCLKSGYTLYQSYYYRKHKFWLSFVVNEMLRLAGKSQVDRLKETPDITAVIVQGFDKLIEKYNEIYDDYLNSLINTNTNYCLNCFKKGESTQLFRCSKCKNVFVCDKKCQKHIQLLHSFDCK
jgi:hypothetical protein